jgi:uncharacterized membrane protein
MAQRKATLERLSSFSDNVFSVIITIMVLELIHRIILPSQHYSLYGRPVLAMSLAISSSRSFG